MDREQFIMVPIQQYFNAYYKMLKLGKYIDISKWFVLNKYTVIPQRIVQNRLKLYKAFDLKLADYKLDLEFAEIKYKRNHATVIVIENSTCKYNHAKENMVSERTGIEYYVELRKSGGRWRIVFMDSDDEDYVLANLRSEQYLGERTTKTNNKRLTQKAISLIKVFDDLDRQIPDLRAMFLGKYLNKMGGEEAAESRAMYSYNVHNGIEYARKYAQYSKIPEKEKLFYYASNGSDCANFVSQCIWAAYGGYVPGDMEQSKKNIIRKNRMVYTGNLNTSWYGTGPGGGGTINWENVNRFFGYATGPKEIGPRGVGYGSVKQSQFEFGRVKPGQVLQFWPASKATWYHSAYVSEVYSTGSHHQIYVCQHSMDIKDRPLIEILNWNTNKGHIRGISFNPAIFSS